MTKRALITGITGQDGSYLAELLLRKDYEVYGLVRRSSSANYSRIQGILDRVHLVGGDLLDEASLVSAVRSVQPDEVYNLGAQSFAGASWEQPILTSEITALGVLRLLNAVRQVRPEARFYQASSSEMFGKVQESPQKETTPFHPRSPYGVAKVFGHMITVNYRESYGMHASNGILMNHESERRGSEFVTRKVTRAAAMIYLKQDGELRLGNLDTRRDWGYAPDFVCAMWKMLQQDAPDDYLIATGVSHSVRELVEVAFDCVGLKWTEYVVQDPAFMRPVETDLLVGDFSKARRVLDWEPTVSFEQMIKRMVVADVEELDQKGSN